LLSDRAFHLRAGYIDSRNAKQLVRHYQRKGDQRHEFKLPCCCEIAKVPFVILTVDSDVDGALRLNVSCRFSEAETRKRSWLHVMKVFTPVALRTVMITRSAEGHIPSKPAPKPLPTFGLRLLST